jgi:hypothetical protein
MCYEAMAFTFEDMERFAAEAWGELGTRTADRWREFNVRFFAGALSPVPLVLTNTLPFGKRIAFCSYSPGSERSGRTITLNVPTQHNELLADNDTLLHEMVHQYLFERGEGAAHDSAGWRREIMRLNLMLTGKEIWAGRSKTVRQDGKVVRINEPHPDTGKVSLTQGQIARWPHNTGHPLGQLGSETPSLVLPPRRRTTQRK